MPKYAYTKELSSEIPSEITLGVSITGCIIRCPECHTRELWEDKGEELTIEVIDRLLKEHQGITTILLLGGEHDIDSLIELFMYAHKRVKTAWYCGLDIIPREKRGILQYLDFVKVGHYDSELGGLDSPTTNQHLYEIEHFANGEFSETDITYKLQKKQ